MSTEGISLNIVENATSDKLSMGDLRKQEEVESQDTRRQSRGLHQVLELQAGECKTETNGLVGFLRKE